MGNLNSGSQRSLAMLPKAHLHIHLEGSMPTGVLAVLAEKYGADAPPTRGYRDFADFAGMSANVLDLVKSKEDLALLVDQVVAEERKQGVVWLELGFIPTAYGGRLGSIAETLELALQLALDAGRRHEIGLGLLVTINRTRDVQEATRIVEIATGYEGQGVVSLGLADDGELRFPARGFREAFRVAEGSGLLVAPHAGELAGQCRRHVRRSQTAPHTTRCACDRGSACSGATR